MDEQRVNELEQSYIALRREKEAVCVDRDAARSTLIINVNFKYTLIYIFMFLHIISTAKIELLKTEIEEKEHDLQFLKKEVGDKDAELQQKDRALKDAEFKLEDINDKYKRRSDECDRLRDDITRQSEQIMSINQRYFELQKSLSSLQSEQTPKDLELLKIKHENDVLTSRVRVLQEEVQIKANAEMDMRRETSGKISDLETKYEISTSEYKAERARVQALNDQVAGQNERINQYMGEVRDLETQLASERSTFFKEIEAQKRMSDLYKRHFEEATEKVSEMEAVVSATKEASAQQQTRLKERMQTELDKAEEIFARQKSDGAFVVRSDLNIITY